MGKNKRKIKLSGSGGPPAMPGLKINPATVPQMKCHCGNINFIKIFNLQYLSPIQTGNPKLNTLERKFYQCTNPACNQLYPSALPAYAIEKIKEAGEKQADVQSEHKEANDQT